MLISGTESETESVVDLLATFSPLIFILKNFRIFQLSVSLYRECLKLRLPRHLKDQMDRATSSIALNFAEGYGKSSPNDRNKFFTISLAMLIRKR